MKVKVAEIIKGFLYDQLQSKKEYLMGNHTIQVDLPKYGNVQYGILHSPDTYSRQWRAIREPEESAADYRLSQEGEDVITDWQGLRITETYKEGSREKHFIIKRIPIIPVIQVSGQAKLAQVQYASEAWGMDGKKN